MQEIIRCCHCAFTTYYQWYRQKSQINNNNFRKTNTIGFFHRHGSTGIRNASNFITSLSSYESNLLKVVSDYLRNGNGNYRKHSFKTILAFYVNKTFPVEQQFEFNERSSTFRNFARSVSNRLEALEYNFIRSNEKYHNLIVQQLNSIQNFAKNQPKPEPPNNLRNKVMRNLANQRDNHTDTYSIAENQWIIKLKNLINQSTNFNIFKRELNTLYENSLGIIEKTGSCGHYALSLFFFFNKQLFKNYSFYLDFNVEKFSYYTLFSFEAFCYNLNFQQVNIRNNVQKLFRTLSQPNINDGLLLVEYKHLFEQKIMLYLFTKKMIVQ